MILLLLLWSDISASARTVSTSVILVHIDKVTIVVRTLHAIFLSPEMCYTCKLISLCTSLSVSFQPDEMSHG